LGILGLLLLVSNSAVAGGLFLFMTDLTLAARFGNDVAFNETTKVLSIDLNNLSSIVVDGADYGLNVTAMTDANKDSYASKIFWALMQRSRSVQPESNNDETIGLYVTNQGKRNVVRNQVAQIGFQLVATAYKTDTIGQNLDPDEIGA